VALTVGTDAYVDLATVNAYHSARGNTAWAAETSSDREVYIRKATDYVDRKWSYIGDKATAAQRLKWPRKYAYVEEFQLDDESIPWQVEEATAIVADLIRQGTFDVEGVLTDSNAAIKRQKVEGAVELEFDTKRRLQGGDIASHVIELLSPLIRSKTGGLSRA